MYSYEEKAYWAALYSSEGWGRRSCFRLQKTLTNTKLSIVEFWALSPDKIQELGISEKLAFSIKNYKKEHNILDFWHQLEKRQIRVHFFNDSAEFPALLQQIDDPPFMLFSCCSAQQLPWHQLELWTGVIGSRNATTYGRQATELLVPQLVELGIGIVSGCMYGIDEFAHRSALAARGQTVAVLGYGFDYCYPESLRSLQSKIVTQGGALITEYPPSVGPRRGQFAQRNRMISGLAQAVLIVEAAQQSGTLITAQCALDQGRTVCCVPGPLQSPYSEGTKQLLNQGAQLVTSGVDVLAQIMPAQVVCQSAAAQEILVCLQKAPVAGWGTQQLLTCMHAQAGQTQLTPATLCQALTELEINGSIMRNGTRYALSHR